MGKRKDTLPYTTTEVELEGVMLSETNQRQILYVITYMWNEKKKTLIKDRLEWWLPGTVGWVKWSKDRNLQLEDKEFWRCNAQHKDFSPQYCDYILHNC